MNLIKRHKGLAIVGGLTLILIIVMFAIFAKMIFSNGESEYGQRLNGLVKVNKSDTNEIISEIKENESVEDIEIRIQGKIIYTTITFKEGTKLDKAKEIASSTISKYEEDIIDYYDFGYFLKEIVEDNEENGISFAYRSLVNRCKYITMLKNYESVPKLVLENEKRSKKEETTDKNEETSDDVPFYKFVEKRN